MPHANEEAKRAYHRAYQKEWRDRNRERLAKQNAAYVAANAEYIKQRLRWQRIKSRYGLSRDEYEMMAAAQKGLCACCGYAPRKMPLCVDHCHETGVIRGLICVRCNTMIEKVRDYLERASGNTRRVPADIPRGYRERDKPTRRVAA